jgi:hypothetical protein
MTQTAAASALAAATASRWAKLIVRRMLMIILDQTITTVALPSIQSDLHFSQSNLAGSSTPCRARRAAASRGPLAT